MAATLAVLSVTPYAIKYQYAYDGADSTLVTKTQAQVIADLSGTGQRNVLRDYLNSLDEFQWAALVGSAKVSFSIVEDTQGAQANVGIGVRTPNNPTRMEVSSGAPLAQSLGGTLEIRFHHSFDR